MFAHRLQIFDTMHTAVWISSSVQIILHVGKYGKDWAIIRVMKRFLSNWIFAYLTFWNKCFVISFQYIFT